VRIVETGPHRATLEVRVALRVPAQIGPDRARRGTRTVALPIVVRAALGASTRRVDCELTIRNTASDHRLRALFPCPGSTEHARAEGHFQVVRRDAQPTWNERWREPPQTTAHTCGAVAAGRMNVYGFGLPEYEALPTGSGGVTLALTLLRAVGWLSRDDFPARPYGAGPTLATPGAQQLGEQSVRLAFELGDRSDAELTRESQRYRLGFAGGPGGGSGVPLVLGGDGFAISALKGAEDGDALVLRVFNPGAEPAGLTIGGALEAAYRCRLDETHVEGVGVGVVALGPYEIATFMLVPRTVAATTSVATARREQAEQAVWEGGAAERRS
jgi:alpha-mannosidase